jgi:hypothetical protein
MTNEEMERAIKFLLDSQAQLTASIGTLSVKVDRTADSVNALLAIAEIHEREIIAVNEAGRATEERLNALILTVDRFIAGRGES